MTRGPSIKAVDLSEVREEKRSAEQASVNAIKQSLEDDLRRKSGKSGRWIWLLAGLFNIYWAGAVGAFVWGLYESGTIELTTQWLATVGAILVLPLFFIWMVALIAKRSQDLKSEANHLAAIAMRLTHPEEQASREITRLGHAVRRQIESLEKEMDLALTRVTQIDNAIRSQAKTLNKTGEETQERMDAVRASLETERLNLEALTQKIADNGQALASEIVKRTDYLQTTSETVSSMLDTADETLQTRLAALSDATATALARTEKTATELDTRIQNLNEASRNAIAQSEIAGTVYDQHLESLNKTTHLLAEEGRALEGRSKDHEHAAKNFASDIARSADLIETSLNRSRSQIEATLSAIKDDAAQLGDDFVQMTVARSEELQNRAIDSIARLGSELTDIQSKADQAGSNLVALAEDRARQLGTVISDSASLIEVSLDSLEKQAEQIGDRIALQVEQATSDASSTLDETAQRLADRLASAEERVQIAGNIFRDNTEWIERHSQSAIQSLENAGDRVQTVASQARQALKKRASEMQQLIEASAASFAGAIDSLAGQNERLKTAFEDQNRLLTQAPALVTEQVEAIEQLVNDTATRIQSAVNDTLRDASSIESRMDEHARTFLTNGEDVLRALNVALEKTRAESESARTAMSARAVTIVSEIEAAAATAEEIMASTEKSLLERAEAMKQLLLQSDQAAGNLTATAKQRLAEDLGAIKSEIDQAEATIQTAIENLAQNTGQIQEVTSGASQVLESALTEMETRFKRLPDQARDSGERIRSIVLTQISSLTDISEEAASRVLNLDAAFQARIRSVYETLARLLPPDASTEQPPAITAGQTQAAPVVPAMDNGHQTTGDMPKKPAASSRDVYPQIWDEMREQPEEQPDADRADEAIAEPETPDLTDQGLAQRLTRRLRRGKPSRFAVDYDGASPHPNGDSENDTGTDRQDGFETILLNAIQSDAKGNGGQAKKMKWREILSAAESNDRDRRQKQTTASASANISRTTDHKVETLQAITVDLNRALANDTPAELVERYSAGERDLFAKRLLGLERYETLSKISGKYENDEEFKSYVDRFISQYADVANGAAENEEPPVSAEIRELYGLLNKAVSDRSN